MTRAFFGALLLYVVALATSMGGMEIFSTLLTVLTLVALAFFPPRPRTVPPFLKPIAVFVVIAIVGILLGGASPQDKLYDLGRMRFFLLYVVFYYALAFYRPGFPWAKILAVVTAILGVYCTVQHFVAIDLVRPEGKKVLMYAIQDQKIGPLVVGTFNHHLTFSNIYLFYACLFTALGLGAFPKKKPLLALGLWLFLLCIWTQSRAAWAAIPLTLFILAAGKGKRIAMGALVATLLLLAVLYRVDPGFHARFERTVFQTDDLYNLGPRQRLWNAQMVFFRESPIIGVGWNNNERRAKEVVDHLYPQVPDNFYGHAHSEVLQILSTTGLLGLLAFLWIWVEIFARIIRALRGDDRWLALGLLAAFVGFHIQGITQWNFGDAEVLHNVIFFWAVAASLRVTEKTIS